MSIVTTVILLRLGSSNLLDLTRTLRGLAVINWR